MKILFIHGLASSGVYKMANSLRIILKPEEVISPDIPIDPDEALTLLLGICNEQKPDLIVGLSLGGFWAQKMRGYRKILVNPDFHPSILLSSRVGTLQYLSPRADGQTSFEITEDICGRYALLEQSQFDGLTAEEIALTKGMFATEDELIHCGDEFEQHYPGMRINYPGKHLPVFPELKTYLAPLVKSINSETLGI